MKQLFARLWRDEEGQDLIEYALLIALITLVAFVAFPPLGAAIKTVFTSTTTCMTTQACGQ